MFFFEVEFDDVVTGKLAHAFAARGANCRNAKISLYSSKLLVNLQVNYKYFGSLVQETPNAIKGFLAPTLKVYFQKNLHAGDGISLGRFFSKNYRVLSFFYFTRHFEENVQEGHLMLSFCENSNDIVKSNL